jgi:hypothetical protein
MLKIFLLSCIWLYSNSIFAFDCPTGQYFVHSHFRSSYYRSDGTFVSSANVEAHCKEYRVSSPLVLKYSSEMPKGWPFQLEIFKPWTSSERKLLEKEIAKLPKALREQGLVTVLRAVKSSFQDNPSTSAPDESIIVFYDSAQSFGYKRVVTHELAHTLYGKLNKNELKTYYEAAGWKETSQNKFSTSRTSFSEPDGALGPDEDFANNVEHLVFNNNYKNILDKKIANCIKSILGISK